MPGKRIKRIVLTAGTILVLVAGIWIGTIIAGWPPGVSAHLNPFAPKVNSTSEAILAEVRDLLQLRTVEYIYKTVFPYDFVPSDLDWKELISRESQDGRLTPSEEILLDRYKFCLSVGIDLTSPKKSFVVITSVVYGGFDLSDTQFADNSVQVIEQSLIIDLPEPQILDLVVEDNNSGEYPYPDISMSPENWKRVTEFVESHVIEEVLGDGIIETARQNGEEILERIFIEGGWGSVAFK